MILGIAQRSLSNMGYVFFFWVWACRRPLYAHASKGAAPGCSRLRCAAALRAGCKGSHLAHPSRFRGCYFARGCGFLRFWYGI